MGKGSMCQGTGLGQYWEMFHDTFTMEMASTDVTDAAYSCHSFQSQGQMEKAVCGLLETGVEACVLT